jgi:hypothetical protein
MTALQEPEAPELFALALVGLRAAASTAQRPGTLLLTEVPAPRRLAPYAVAISAEVSRDDEQIANGRLVVLHDPAGQQGWWGETRVVAFVSADVEAEMGADPALADVGWSWLTESLAGHRAEHTAAGGTVTRTVSSTYGQIAPDGRQEGNETNEVEIRASWTALADGAGRLDLGTNLQAWCDLLCATAGLPPPGVASLPPPRRG